MLLQEFFEASYASDNHRDRESAENIEATLLHFLQDVKPNYQITFLDFWAENKERYPELYKLANVVSSVPATQVSVERLFSLLRYVLVPVRNRLKKKTIRNIMNVKCNLQVVREFTP